MRRKSEQHKIEIYFEKVDGTVGHETFNASSPDEDAAIQEFLNTRIAVRAWTLAEDASVREKELLALDLSA